MDASRTGLRRLPRNLWIVTATSFLRDVSSEMIFNLVYAILSSPLGALSDKIGRRRLILCGWIAYGLVYLGFGASRTGWHVWLMYGLYGVYYAATEGSTKAFIADLVAPDQRGKAYGICNAVTGLMALPASVVAGLLWQGGFGWKGFGPSAPFFFGAGLAVVSGMLFCKLVNDKKPALTPGPQET